MNLEKADQILQQLARAGVSTICLCPGARNAPFVKLLSEKKGFEVLSFYDERSAGFFALGRARRDQAPVVVCTTSGTAVSELLSPVIEAFYSNTPLVILSADRPKRLRGTGAPQAIEQWNIFSGYVDKSWDLSLDDLFEWSNSKKPSHINICFDEPLLSGEVSSDSYQVASPQLSSNQEPVEFGDYQFPEKTLVVLGALNKSQQSVVEKALASLKLPIFAESLSGLVGSRLIEDKLLKSGEKLISKMVKSGDVESVLRIGDVPVGRYWRDLDQLSIPVLSLSDKAFSGTDKSQLIETSLNHLDLTALEALSWDWSEWKAEDEEKQKKINALMGEFPKSEVSLFKSLSQQISLKDQVYIGNSLPVRVWDLIRSSHAQVFASRGVNGIDGQLSTAIGLHQKNQASWTILGDLTTLYDFSGFWLSSYLKKEKAQFNFVTINNKGGQIFSRIFEEPLFRNEHDLEFSKMAEMWGWNYIKANSCDSLSLNEGLNFIEIQPDLEQTKNFWELYDQLWEK